MKEAPREWVAMATSSGAPRGGIDAQRLGQTAECNGPLPGCAGRYILQSGKEEDEEALSFEAWLRDRVCVVSETEINVQLGQLTSPDIVLAPGRSVNLKVPAFPSGWLHSPSTASPCEVRPRRHNSEASLELLNAGCVVWRQWERPG